MLQRTAGFSRPSLQPPPALSVSCPRPFNCVPLQQPCVQPQIQAQPCSLLGVRRMQSTRSRALPPSLSPAALPVPEAASEVQSLYSVSEGLETPIQLLYLLALLAFLSVGAFLVVRQVLIRRELDEAAKGLGERIRTGEASCEVRS